MIFRQGESPHKLTPLFLSDAVPSAKRRNQFIISLRLIAEDFHETAINAGKKRQKTDIKYEKCPFSPALIKGLAIQLIVEVKVAFTTRNEELNPIAGRRD